jgi:hypothetical protein
MTIPMTRFRVVALLAVVFAVASILGTAPLARATDTADIGEMQTRIEPSVVTVKTNVGLGSGFVADASGLIVTNYHVIEGAKKSHVEFPSDKDKKGYPVEGFLAILPSRDLALLKINPGDKKLVPLVISDKLPARGAWIATFGSPLGLALTAAEGKISAVRSGPELIDLTKRGPKSIYEMLGYDPKSTWLQHTAPMSHGNSGGPLINSHGEVVGINTWTLPEGQNLNFAISSPHIKEFVTTAPKTVQSLANLPAPREKGPAGPSLGDPVATMKIWKALNKARNTLDTKVAASEKFINENPPPNPGWPPHYHTKWAKKIGKVYRQISADYGSLVATLRSLKAENADNKLILEVVNSANTFQKLSAAYESIGNDIERANGRLNIDTSSIKMLLADINSNHDALRVNLSRTYGETFPTLEDTKNEGNSSSNDDSKKDDSASKGDSSDDTDRAVLRTWTDTTGKFKVQARYRGMEDGKAKLEKPDGTIIRVPVEKLSEKDRHFIGADE